MESHPPVRKPHPKLETLGMVLLGLGLLTALGGIALRLVYGVRHLGGIRISFVMLALMAAGSVVRSHATLSKRTAWVITALSVLGFSAFVLSELFIPD